MFGYGACLDCLDAPHMVGNLFDLLHKFQERALALSENRPSPALYSSADIRSLRMDDFRYAHEQVFNELYAFDYCLWT